MGSTGKTRKTKEPVVKGSGTGGSAAVNDNGTANKCALIWEFVFRASKTITASVGDKAALISAINGQDIELLINSVSVGEYHEQNERLVSECMKKGFVYEGEVTKVLGNSTFGIKLKGNG